jgi:hypothetical protein
LPKRAAGYERDLEGFRNADYLDMSIPGAAGAMYSTAEDLLRWDQALYGEVVLDEAGKAEMFRPRLETYALGWAVMRLQPGSFRRMEQDSAIQPDATGELITAHGGSINGFNARLVRLVEGGRLIVLLNNTGNTILGRMTSDILSILYGQPYRLPRQPAAPLLWETVLADGVAAAVRQFRGFVETGAEDVEAGEGELVRLARHCRMRGRATDAVVAAEAGAELFPAALGPRLELAEALAAAGDVRRSADELRRMLEQRPELPGHLRRHLRARLAAGAE